MLLILLVLVVVVVELEATGGLFGFKLLLVLGSGSLSFWLTLPGLAVLPSLFGFVPVMVLLPVTVSPLMDAGDGTALLCCICGEELFDRSTERSL